MTLLRRWSVVAPRPLAEFAGIALPPGVSGAPRLVYPAIRWSLLPGHLADLLLHMLPTAAARAARTNASPIKKHHQPFAKKRQPMG